jgi:hypothetical protein
METIMLFEKMACELGWIKIFLCIKRIKSRGTNKMSCLKRKTGQGKAWQWVLTLVLLVGVMLLGPVPNTLAAANSRLAVGHSHSLALKSDGTVWAWGDNQNGQLGDGTTVNKSITVSEPAAINAIESDKKPAGNAKEIKRQRSRR